MAGRLEDELGAAAVAVAAVAILITIWLTVKAAELVIRVMVAHPTNKAMWVALGAFFLATLGPLLTHGQYPFLDAMPFVALLALIVTAKVVELSHDRLLQREWSPEAVVHEVLHEPWWNVA